LKRVDRNNYNFASQVIYDATVLVCVILETLLVPQSYSTDLAPELVSLGGALLADVTEERHEESHM
jgi:hypothetical protein